MILPRDNEEKEELLKALVAERFQTPCQWCGAIECPDYDEHQWKDAQRETSWRE